jgi:hypothetical protein
MITPLNKRMALLSKSGIPLPLLQAIENTEAHGDLHYVIRHPGAAYFYLPKIYHTRTYLNGYEITPICDGCNGEIFYVQLTNQINKKFISFSLENDAFYTSFDQDFRYLFADLLIQLYESSELLTTELIEIGKKLGFKNASALFSSLDIANETRERATFLLDSVWRNHKLPLIIGD